MTSGQPTVPPTVGEMASRIRSHNWAATPLGAMAQWPDGLRTAIDTMLSTRHPATVVWGEELIFLYNDGCAALLGAEKHPSILGLPGSQAWPEAHGLVEEEIRHVLRQGEPVWQENRQIPIRRHGTVEDAWWTYSRSPIHDARSPNGIGGVLTLITETTRPMLAQRESEARFKALFEQSPLMVHIFDRQGQTVAVNPALQRNFGVTAEQMRGYNIFKDPQLKEGDTRRLLDRVYGGEIIHSPPLRHDAAVSTGSGRARWVETTAYPVKDELGEVGEVVILTQDITPRVEAEAALDEAEARFRIAREAAQLGIFDFDFRRGVCIWDERIRELWGVGPDEKITDEIFMGGVHPEDRGLVDQALALATTAPSDGTYKAEYRVVHRSSKETRWLLATGRVFFDADIPVRLVGTVQDMSERRAYEDALRTSEERLQIGLAAAKLGHWSWDTTTDVAVFSERACAIFGIKTPEVTWRSLQKLLHAQDRPHAIEAVKASLASGEDYTIEYRVNRPDGGQVWVSALGRPIYAAGGMPKGMIGVVQDVSERKANEEKIRLLMAEVNHRSKNMLAVVQSIAHQTSVSGSPRAFARRFGERLQGLAASHDLLVNNGWQSVDLAELVASQLAPFRDIIRNRITFEGPDVALQPAAAQALGMALHELATNAGKYGALSSDHGQVRISWSLSTGTGARFRMSWNESGGPPVKEPAASGFGSKLIAQLTEVALQGRVSLAYPPEGAMWTLDAPLETVTNIRPASRRQQPKQ